MATHNEGLPRSKQIGKKAIFTALTILKENGGQMLNRDVIEAVGMRIELDDWARERYSKTGYVRWESILHFETIAPVKAGFLIKKKGTWFITPEGELALSKGENDFYSSAAKAYVEWRKAHPREIEEEVFAPSEEEQSLIDVGKALEQTEQLAYE